MCQIEVGIIQNNSESVQKHQLLTDLKIMVCHRPFSDFSGYMAKKIQSDRINLLHVCFQWGNHSQSLIMLLLLLQNTTGPISARPCSSLPCLPVYGNIYNANTVGLVYTLNITHQLATGLILYMASRSFT